MNLKEYLFYRGISRTRFSKICDLSASYICSIISGRAVPSKKTCRLIERATEGAVKAGNVYAPCAKL